MDADASGFFPVYGQIEASGLFFGDVQNKEDEEDHKGEGEGKSVFMFAEYRPDIHFGIASYCVILYFVPGLRSSRTPG